MLKLNKNQKKSFSFDFFSVDSEGLQQLKPKRVDFITRQDIPVGAYSIINFGMVTPPS
jgi:hypothetical protein